MKQIMIVLICLCLFSSPIAVSGVLYTETQLKAAGHEWTNIKNRWQKVEAHYQKKITYIENRKDLSPAKRKQIIQREKTVLRRKSNALAVQRDQIQQMLINETNARMKGKGATSEPIKQSAGTELGKKGHRGMDGDLDAGGSELATKKMKQVVKEMGLKVKIQETPGTIEFGDEFEFTVNKSGIKAKPGDAFHQTKISVDAQNKEVYISESMKQRYKEGKLKGKVKSHQPGADYVTVQDHKKKAMKGLLSDGDALVKNPDAMQGMAKGTTKTLSDAKVDDETLGKILKQRGIKKTAAEFREHLKNIKEQKTSISDPAEAKKIRDVSEDVFNAAETKTRNKAKGEMKGLKEQIAKAKASGDTKKAQRLSDEYIDSRVKMEETHLANEENFRKNKRSNKTSTDIADGTAKTRISEPEVRTAKPSRADLDSIPSGKTWKTRIVKTRAVVNKVYPIVTTIVDIAQASQTLEDYIAGKITTKEAGIRIAEQSPIGGLITAGRKIDQSSDDWWAATRITAQTNRKNRVNYYNQWYIRLVKSGINKKQAREMVGDAMLTGDDTELDSTAMTQKMNGHSIKRPELIIEVVVADDNVLERTWETGKGIVVGTYDGFKYILTAPYRVVEAWGQGELKEADLKYQSTLKTEFSKTRMYRLLRAAGISRGRAMIAINDFYNNNDSEWLRQALAAIKNNKDMLAKWRKESKKLFAVRTKINDRYCTNRPIIGSDVALSSMIKAKDNTKK